MALSHRLPYFRCQCEFITFISLFRIYCVVFVYYYAYLKFNYIYINYDLHKQPCSTTTFSSSGRYNFASSKDDIKIQKIRRPIINIPINRFRLKLLNNLSRHLSRPPYRSCVLWIEPVIFHWYLDQYMCVIRTIYNRL